MCPVRVVTVLLPLVPVIKINSELLKSRGYFQDKEYFDEHLEWINDHVKKHFPDAEVKVFHEFMALDFKLHVYFIQPNNLNYNILLCKKTFLKN